MTTPELPALSGWLAKKHRSDSFARSATSCKCSLRFFWCTRICIHSKPRHAQTRGLPPRPRTPPGPPHRYLPTPRVDDASGYLHYSSSEKKTPNFSLDMTSITAVLPSNRDLEDRVWYVTEKGIYSTKSSTSASFGFEVVTGGPTPNLYVYALNAETAKTWVHGLQVPRPQPQPHPQPQPLPRRRYPWMAPRRLDHLAPPSTVAINAPPCPPSPLPQAAPSPPCRHPTPPGARGAELRALAVGARRVGHADARPHRRGRHLGRQGEAARRPRAVVASQAELRQRVGKQQQQPARPLAGRAAGHVDEAVLPP